MNNNESTNDTNSNSSPSFSAAYGILPAVASTMCCWGPPLLSMIGASTAAASTAGKNTSPSTTTSTIGNTAVLLSRRIGQYRPYLLGLSATMIGYSFTKVYGQELQQLRDNYLLLPFPSNKNSADNKNDNNNGGNGTPSCCHDEKLNHRSQDLQFQRAVVWASLAVAIAGASYGRRVRIPSTITMNASTKNTRTNKSHRTANTTSVLRLELHIDGMACGGCGNKVQTALEGIDGVQNVMVDHENGKAQVELLALNENNEEEDELEVAQKKEWIKKAIEKAGFHPRY